MDRLGKKTYHTIRVPYDPKRDEVWKAIAEDIMNRFSVNKKCIVDLGCGYGEFIRNVRAAKRIGIDIHPDMANFMDEGIEFHNRHVLDMDFLEDNSVDMFFASNLIEHLNKDDARKLFATIFEKLANHGRFIVLQPNFRLCYKNYFDDYTHESIYTDESLCDFLQSCNYSIVFRKAGYLPFSMKSRLPRSYWMTKLFLKLKSPLLGKQMLVVAKKEL